MLIGKNGLFFKQLIVSTISNCTGRFPPRSARIKAIVFCNFLGVGGRIYIFLFCRAFFTATVTCLPPPPLNPLLDYWYSINVQSKTFGVPLQKVFGTPAPPKIRNILNLHTNCARKFQIQEKNYCASKIFLRFFMINEC